MRVLKNFAKLSARVSFLIMPQAEGSNIVEKEAVAQVFSCEICEIFKSKFYIMKRLR